MRDTALHVWRNPWARVFLVALLAVLAYLFLARTAPIWLSLLIAYTIAYLTHPLTRWIASRGVPEWVGGVVTVGVLLLVVAILSLVLQQVVSQLGMLLDRLPGLIGAIQALPERLPAALPEHLGQQLEDALASLRTPLEDLTRDLGSWIREHSRELLGGISTVVLQFLRLVVVPVMTLYLIFDFRRVNDTIRRAVPPRHRDGFDAFVRRLDHAVGAYLKAQIVLATMVGLMVWLGLAVLGMPMALALGFLAGAGNLIPFFGPILAGIPAVLVAMGEGGIGLVIPVVVVLVAVQQVDGNILTPIVFSRTTQLHPLAVILAILVGSTLFGLWGAIAAVPVAVFLVSLYRDRYFDSAFYRGTNEGDDA